jgi:hypothetical protein
MCSRSAGGTQQVRGDLRRVLEVVAAQQGDPARVLRVFHRGLERPLEGDKPDESKGREENQAEPEEDRPQAARGRDQAEGDEAAGDRREEHVCPAGRLGDRRGPGALERKVLRCHERHRRGALVVLVGAVRLAVDRGFPSP